MNEKFGGVYSGVQSTLAHVPGAASKIVHDPFHLVKYINEAVNEVRKSARIDIWIRGIVPVWVRQRTKFAHHKVYLECLQLETVLGGEREHYGTLASCFAYTFSSA